MEMEGFESLEDMPGWFADLLFRGTGMDSPSPRDLQLRTDLQTLIRYRRSNSSGRDTLSAREIEQVVRELPRLAEDDLKDLGHYDSACPICLNAHVASLAEEEHAHVVDSPAHPIEDLGVTRLAQTCGHLFCRKDILTWIRDGHPSCPMCRTAFIKPPDRTEQSNTEPAAASAEEAEAEFDAALSRILAAYQEERERLNAAPTSTTSYSLLGYAAPHPSYESAEYDNDRDGSDFSGMYS